MKTIQQKLSIFLFAAGLGTRLRPLTDTIPKPMVEVKGKPLISYAIDFYEQQGFSEIVINTFHLPKAFDVLAQLHQNIKLNIILEKEILGHAGGLKNAENFLNSEFILAQNSDTILRYDFDQIILELGNMKQDEQIAMTIFTFNSEKNPLKVKSGTLRPKDSPKFDYQTDAVGLYLIRTNVLDFVPENVFTGFFGSEDLVDLIWKKNFKVACIELKDFVRYEVTNLEDLENLNSISLKI